MAYLNHRRSGRQAPKFISLTLLGLAAFAMAGCKSAPNVNQDIGSKNAPAARAIPTDQIKISQGMKITISQNFPLSSGKDLKMLSDIHRRIEVQTPLSSEGITFKWDLKWEGSATPESAPSAELGGTESYQEEGMMTLADLVQSRTMTLPAFWPPGELYLANSSAIWLSDRSFQDLKKNKSCEWNLGLVGSSLWGAVPNAALFEALIQKFQQALEKEPEKLLALKEIKLIDGSDTYSMKINGQLQEVDTLIAGNWLAQYRVLNNTLNPLILEVSLLPEAKTGDVLFSPLAPIKALLEYRVEAIDLPAGKIGQSF